MACSTVDQRIELFYSVPCVVTKYVLTTCLFLYCAQTPKNYIFFKSLLKVLVRLKIKESYLQVFRSQNHLSLYISKLMLLETAPAAPGTLFSELLLLDHKETVFMHALIGMCNPRKVFELRSVLHESPLRYQHRGCIFRSSYQTFSVEYRNIDYCFEYDTSEGSTDTMGHSDQESVQKSSQVDAKSSKLL